MSGIVSNRPGHNPNHNLYQQYNPLLGEKRAQDNETATKQRGKKTDVRLTAEQLDSERAASDRIRKASGISKVATRSNAIKAADAYLPQLITDWELDPESAAYVYHEVHPTVPPYPVRYWKNDCRTESWGGFNKGTRPYERYFDQIVDPYFYSLHLSDLPIPAAIQKMIDWESIFRPVDLYDPWQIYRNATILKALLRYHLPKGALIAKIETNLKEPCLHAVAERDAGLLHIPRLEAKQSGKCSPVYERVRLVGYLLKPVLSDPKNRLSKEESIERLAIFIAASRDFREPHPEVFDQYRAARPGRKITKEVRDRAAAKRSLPNMFDFYPAKTVGKNA